MPLSKAAAPLRSPEHFSKVRNTARQRDETFVSQSSNLFVCLQFTPLKSNIINIYLWFTHSSSNAIVNTFGRSTRLI